MVDGTSDIVRVHSAQMYIYLMYILYGVVEREHARAARHRARWRTGSITGVLGPALRLKLKGNSHALCNARQCCLRMGTIYFTTFFQNYTEINCFVYLDNM